MAKLFAFIFLFFVGLPAWAGVEQLPEKEFRELAKELAPKVNLFRDAWEQDPKAEFYGGTSRDFLYWLKGQFIRAKNPEAARKVATELRALPLIDVKEFIIGDSDIDIVADSSVHLNALDYGVRKIDTQSRDIFDPKTELGFSERHQGHAPAEKIRLGREGMLPNPGLGDGAKEIYEGKITVQFAPAKDFAKTKFAKEGINHPVLLALRYIRLSAMDYFRTHGAGAPDNLKLTAGLDPRSVEEVKRVIEEAKANQSLSPYLKQNKFKSWINGSIQKAFRSYTNPSAARELMTEFGVDELVERYGGEIEPINQYVFAKHRDQAAIDRALKRAKVNPTELFVDPAKAFPDGLLYHGTRSEDAFRGIIFQGIMASQDGSAGAGLYGVPLSQKNFSENWAGDKNRLIKFRVQPEAKIIDITKGKGAELWRDFGGRDYEKFAEAYGADMIRYPYGETEAYVVKNSAALGKAEGVYRNLLTLSQFHEEIKKVKSSAELVKMFQAPNYSSGERKMLADEIASRLAKESSIDELIQVYRADKLPSFDLRDIWAAAIAKRAKDVESLTVLTEFADSPGYSFEYRKLIYAEIDRRLAKAPVSVLTEASIAAKNDNLLKQIFARRLVKVIDEVQDPEIVVKALNFYGEPDEVMAPIAKRVRLDPEDTLKYLQRRNLSEKDTEVAYKYLLGQAEDPVLIEYVKRAMKNEAKAHNLAHYVLSKPAWEKHPDVLLSFIKSAPEFYRTALIKYLGESGFWRRRPDLLRQFMARKQEKILFLSAYFGAEEFPDAWDGHFDLYESLVRSGDSDLVRPAISAVGKLKELENHPELLLDHNEMLYKQYGYRRGGFDDIMLSGKLPKLPLFKKIAKGRAIDSASSLAQYWQEEKSLRDLVDMKGRAVKDPVKVFASLRELEMDPKRGAKILKEADIPSEKLLAFGRKATEKEDLVNLVQYHLGFSPGPEEMKLVKELQAKGISRLNHIVNESVFGSKIWMEKYPDFVMGGILSAEAWKIPGMVDPLNKAKVWEKHPEHLSALIKRMAADQKSHLLHSDMFQNGPDPLTGKYKHLIPLFLRDANGKLETSFPLLHRLVKAAASKTPQISVEQLLDINLAVYKANLDRKDGFHWMDNILSHWKNDPEVKRLLGKKPFDTEALAALWEAEQSTRAAKIPPSVCAGDFARLGK